MYDLCATRTGMPSFRKRPAILQFRRSEMHGIPKHDHSALRSRVPLAVLRVFSLVYNAFRISIETEDVIKITLMLPGCRFRKVFIFDAFPFITKEVDF